MKFLDSWFFPPSFLEIFPLMPRGTLDDNDPHFWWESSSEMLLFETRIVQNDCPSACVLLTFLFGSANCQNTSNPMDKPKQAHQPSNSKKLPVYVLWLSFGRNWFRKGHFTRGFSSKVQIAVVQSAPGHGRRQKKQPYFIDDWAFGVLCAGSACQVWENKERQKTWGNKA